MALKKIDYACAIPALFTHNLHQEGLDRGMIATFGNTFRIEQEFTTTTAYLHEALAKVSRSVDSEGTRLYDSLEDMVREIRKQGRPNCPWMLTVITDGMDNRSRSSNSPVRVGQYIDQYFSHESSN